MVIKEGFSLPVFIRTDQASGKHHWKDSCFYDGGQPLHRHLFNVCEANHCAGVFGLEFEAIAVREYIPMASRLPRLTSRPCSPLPRTAPIAPRLRPVPAF